VPRVSLHTLGCKLNFAETSSLGGQFLDRGFELVEFGAEADVIVINTCSVTERADRECRQIIRRALRTSKDAVVLVTGCYAQLEPEEVASINGVDVVLGSKEKFHLFDYLPSLEKSGYPRVFVSDIGHDEAFGAAMSGPTGDRTRAFLKVQDGCDYQCSFCTIPRARGVSRSQPIETCVAQAEALVEHGFKEIVLTGVNVGDYGRKMGSSLYELLEQLVLVPGLERLRVSSIEPNLLTEDILKLAASSDVLCNHFHVPLQSGSDAILHAMRRRYSTSQYRDLITAIREQLPDCGIGVDVITGFPGETEAQFAGTLRFLEDLPVSYLHVFTYSERPNTPAATYGSPVEPKERFHRNEVLRAIGEKKKHAFYEGMIGKTVRVLAEGVVEDGRRFGFTDNFVRAALPVECAVENELVTARIVSVADDVCLADRVGPKERA
jgi:threonylcarbamoyladenosine tRNA methylthiotransferase MtaB